MNNPPGFIWNMISKIIDLFSSRFTKKQHLRRQLGALRVEIQNCANVAQTYCAANIKSPNYDLPTKVYEELFSDFIREIDVDETTQRLLEAFYTNVRALNRGIVNANEFRKAGNLHGLDEEWNRNCIKAKHVLELHDAAVTSVTKIISKFS